MLTKLILLFVGLPLVEIMILVKLGEEIGFWPTILLLLITGVLGATLARAQGFRILRQIQQDLEMGRMPADKLIDGLLVFMGGVVLLTPGLLTDLFGLALLFPLTRKWIKNWLRNKLEKMIVSGETHYTFFIR